MYPYDNRLRARLVIFVPETEGTIEVRSLGQITAPVLTQPSEPYPEGMPKFVKLHCEMIKRYHDCIDELRKYAKLTESVIQRGLVSDHRTLENLQYGMAAAFTAETAWNTLIAEHRHRIFMYYSDVGRYGERDVMTEFIDKHGGGKTDKGGVAPAEPV